MNLTVLKSPAFWISAVSAVLALLVSSGVVLSGSSVDHVIAYVVALLGALGGHSLASGPTTPPAA